MRSEWSLLEPLGLALVLSSAIGLERETRAKSAGLRTHSLVGMASALIVLLSAYGFSSVLSPGRVVLDPCWAAAARGGHHGRALRRCAGLSADGPAAAGS